MFKGFRWNSDYTGSALGSRGYGDSLQGCVIALSHKDRTPRHSDARPLKFLLKEGGSGLHNSNLVVAEGVDPLFHVVVSRRRQQHRVLLDS